jgi:hypothetical protein
MAYLRVGSETALLSAIAELRASLWLEPREDTQRALDDALMLYGVPPEPFIRPRECASVMPDGWLREKRLLHMSVDHYQSFARIGEVLAAAGCSAGDSVLDVGGADGSSGLFLPFARYMVVDPETNGLSALPISLPTGFADYAITNDTLEHIPGPDRPQFIAELVRVARKGVCLQAPFQPPGAERAIEDAFYSVFPNRWTYEHMANGLPTVDDVDRILTSLGVTFSRRIFGDLASQYWMLTCTWMWQYVGLDSSRLNFNYFSNSRYRQADNPADPVGYVYVIRPTDTNEPEKNRGITDWKDRLESGR